MGPGILRRRPCKGIPMQDPRLGFPSASSQRTSGPSSSCASRQLPCPNQLRVATLFTNVSLTLRIVMIKSGSHSVCSRWEMMRAWGILTNVWLVIRETPGISNPVVLCNGCSAGGENIHNKGRIKSLDITDIFHSLLPCLVDPVQLGSIGLHGLVGELHAILQ